MKLTDLTREQLLLINTNFGPALEKQAAAIVNNEFGKVAEMQNVAESLVTYGAELAMQKIAEMEEKYQEGATESEEGDEESASAEEGASEEEEEKTASAMGNFILEGYWNTMLEKGAEYYGRQNAHIYIEELCKQAGVSQIAKKAVKAVKGAAKKTKKVVKPAVKGAWSGVQKDTGVFGKALKQAVTGTGPGGGKANRLSNLKRAVKTKTGIGAGIGLGLGGAYGVKKALD